MVGTAPDRPGDDKPAAPAEGKDGRDRDSTGRARNARPRDELGRPLPYGSADVARQPEGIVRSPDETLREAQQLLDAGRPFHAHEVFEDAWKTSTGGQDQALQDQALQVQAGGQHRGLPDSTGRYRALWKGLAQLAVGLTHLARGNLRGARTLLQRGGAAIAPYGAESPFGIDVTGLVRWASDLVARIDDGAVTSDAGVAMPRLCRPSLN